MASIQETSMGEVGRTLRSITKIKGVTKMVITGRLPKGEKEAMLLGVKVGGRGNQYNRAPGEKEEVKGVSTVLDLGGEPLLGK